MKILQAASEVFPYSKTGGLADMVAGLSKALAASGQQVGIVTPLYSGIGARFPGLEDWGSLEIPMGEQVRSASIRTLAASENLTVYFVDEPGYYDRGGIYNENGVDFADNAERYIFFSKCVVELAARLEPDLIHLHDWQTGLIPAILKHQSQARGWETTPRTCFSIHNLVYQGIFPRVEFQKTGLPDSFFHLDSLEYFGQLNCLKAGIAMADLLSTVSPTYAREITTEEYGANLDGVLRKREDVLTGILNGVDYDEWNTTGNPHLKHSYDAENLRGKSLLKRSLQKEFGLPQNSRIPIFATVTRLDPNQKGIGILLDALKASLAQDFQFILLGSGDAGYESEFAAFAAEHPTRIGVRIGYDHPLAHRIEAGCDFFLMPSRYEPCGLNQMYSLRYGSIPIVRATGGLEDSVIEFHEDPDLANGLKFREYSAEALAKCIRRAVVMFETPGLLKRLRVAGMKADHSWNRTATEYIRFYNSVPVV